MAEESCTQLEDLLYDLRVTCFTKDPDILKQMKELEN